MFFLKNFCLSTGIFFVLPCTDTIMKVDLRTVSFDIPPQEVGVWAQRATDTLISLLLRGHSQTHGSRLAIPDPDQGLGHSHGGRSGVLPGL